MSVDSQMAVARRLAQRRFEHPLLSASLDLDPTRFATAAARATEINSLVDEARRQLRQGALDHADRAALKGDVERVERYLTRELDASGALGVACYCSKRAQLFEAVALKTPTESAIWLEPLPRLEPLLPALEPALVCVALVSRREARLLMRPRGRTAIDDQSFEDPVHGKHRQGGWSQANYERSIEADVDAHLQRTATRLHQLWQQQRFDRLVLGGPHEVVVRLSAVLHPVLREILDPAELPLEPGPNSAVEVEAALEPLRARWRELAQTEALQNLLATLDGRPGVSANLGATLAALEQRQVDSLVLGLHADPKGAICPTCEQLYRESEHACPADGSRLVPVPSLRSAMIRAAIRQDAKVIVLSDLDDRPEVGAFGGVGALLRY